MTTYGFNFELWSGESPECSPALCSRRAGDTMVYADEAFCIGGGSVMPTIVSSFFKGPGSTQDVCMIVQRTMWDGKEVHPTITVHNAGSGGQMTPDKGNFNGIVEQMEEEKTYTKDDDVVGYDNHPNDSRITEADGAYQSLTSRCGTGGGNTPMVGTRYAVRRITPIEAERLMGFPDGWTIPCFKPEDITDELCEYFQDVMYTWDCINAEEGKTPKMKTISQVRKWLTEISQGKIDSPRYKACGNSMCVNCMEWIGERIDLAMKSKECANDQGNSSFHEEK